MYSELHGTKALIFLIFINLLVGVLVAVGAVDTSLFSATLFASLGYAFGNTVLKKHRSDAENIANRSNNGYPAEHGNENHHPNP